MPIYPKKIIPKAEGGLSFDLSNLTNGQGGLNSSLSGLASTGADMIFGDKIKSDNRGFQTTRSMGNYMGSSAVKGAAMGAQFGVVGAGVGAVLGAGAGLLQGKKIKKEADNHNRVLLEGNHRNLNSAGNSMFQANVSKMGNTLYKKGGCIYPKGRRMFAEGGVILGGKSHDEKGNLIVDENNEPVAETESEELLLSLEQTQQLDQIMQLVEKTPDDLRFAELGKFFAQNILPNIQDNSGKFMLNKAV